MALMSLLLVVFSHCSHEPELLSMGYYSTGGGRTVAIDHIARVKHLFNVSLNN